MASNGNMALQQDRDAEGYPSPLRRLNLLEWVLRPSAFVRYFRPLGFMNQAREQIPTRFRLRLEAG